MIDWRATLSRASLRLDVAASCSRRRPKTKIKSSGSGRRQERTNKESLSNFMHSLQFGRLSSSSSREDDDDVRVVGSTTRDEGHSLGMQISGAHSGARERPIFDAQDPLRLVKLRAADRPTIWLTVGAPTIHPIGESPSKKSSKKKKTRRRNRSA